MRLTTILGLAALVIVLLGLQMMVSGFSVWLAGPTVSYRTYKATSQEFTRQIPPFSTREAWETGIRVANSTLYRDSWINFTVLARDYPVNLYVTRTTTHAAYVSIINVTGSKIIVFRPPDNGTYMLAIENNSTRVANVLVSSALYIVGPHFDYATIEHGLEAAKQASLISVLALLVSGPFLHSGLVWVLSLPRLLRGRKYWSVTYKRVRPVAYLFEVCASIMILAPIFFFLAWTDENVGIASSEMVLAPNLVPAIRDLGIRYTLFYLLGIAVSFGLILFIALLLFETLDNVIVRLSSATATEESKKTDLQILADAYFRKNITSRRYLPALFAGFVLSQLLYPIAGGASIIGLMFIGGTVLSFAEYESLREAARMLEYAWSGTIISAISRSLRTFFSALFMAPVIFGCARYLVPAAVDFAVHAVLSRFVLWQFMPGLGQRILAVWGPLEMLSSLDKITSGVLFYWSLWLVLWGSIYAVFVPYMLGVKDVASSLASEAMIGIFLFVSIQLTSAWMGVAGVPALTSALAFSAAGSLLAALLKRSMRMKA